MAGNSAQAGRTVVNKISTILLLFNEGSEHSLTEIARLADVPLSSTQRYVTELVGAGFLRRAGRARYGAGSAFRNIGAADSRPATLTERAPYVVDDLSHATNSRVRLGILGDWNVLGHWNVAYIEKVPGLKPPTAFRAAATVPAHATAMGRCLLAFASTAFVDRLIVSGLVAYTAHTVIDSGEVRRALAIIRRTHIAVTREELEVGVCGVAMPVFGPRHQAVAAIEVAVHDPDASLPALLAPLAVACRSLSRELDSSLPVTAPDSLLAPF
jgi:DNA-binding IclR family transcriptional regulator